MGPGSQIFARICLGLLSYAVVMRIIASTPEAMGNVRKLPKLCSAPGEGHKCEMKPGRRVICRGDYKAQYRREYSTATTVVLCLWSEEYLNPEDVLVKFPVVRKLIIKNGNVSHFLTDFPSSEHLETLILNHLPVETLRPSLLSSLKNLKHLDLGKNRLKNLGSHIASEHPSLKRLILTDNPWDCSLDMKWILSISPDVKLVNVTRMVCSGERYPGKPVYAVMLLIKSMEGDCPKDVCTCTAENIVWDTEQRYLVPVITVNCTGRGLFAMPERIPGNTTTLLLNRNNITDLLPLIKNEVYTNIADIYLDYNNIKNVDLLEGSHWLTQFRVLSLKGNCLKELPTFALDNAFEKNSNMAKIYLGENPWKCDCLFTSEFQHLLIKYRSVIKDRNDIRCAEVEGHFSSPTPLVDVSLSSVCSPATFNFNPLDILSGVLASMIVLVVGKLIYDYCAFKRSGKLPWIVTKMP